jgi:hypothetical protein
MDSSRVIVLSITGLSVVMIQPSTVLPKTVILFGTASITTRPPCLSRSTQKKV